MTAEHGCPFCEIVATTRPAHVVLATPTVVAFMDQYRQPADPCHVLVIPREHVENIHGVSDAVGADLFSAHAQAERGESAEMRGGGRMALSIGAVRARGVRFSGAAPLGGPIVELGDPRYRGLVVERLDAVRE